MSYQGNSASNIPLHWNNICTHADSYYTDGYQDLCPQQIHDTIAFLCRQIGNLSNSVYMDYETGTTIPNIRTALQGMGYTLGSTTSYTSSTFLNTELQNKLVMMFGEGILNNKIVFHSWAVDGCYFYRVHYYETTIIDTVYFHGVPRYIYGEIFDGGTTSHIYNHVNWGWNGRDNGYFYGVNFNPTYSNMYDDPDRYQNKPSFTTNVQYFTVRYE